MKRIALVVLAVVASLAFARSAHAEVQDARVFEPSAALPLDRVVPIAIAAGQEIEIRGSLRTAYDGATFDAPDLFDADAGGLRLVSFDPSTHVARFVGSGANAPACRDAGLPAPCLVPRMAEIAHARLLSVGELAGTLSGGLDLALESPPPISARAWRAANALSLGLGAASLVALVVLGLLVRHQSPMGRVRAAAKDAREATTDDVSLATLHAHVSGLVERAEQLDLARLASLERLATIDRRALARKRASLASSGAAASTDALAWIDAELAEAARLESTAKESAAGLERVASALRLIALRARSPRSAHAPSAAIDPVASAADDLAIHEEAVAEAERVV